MASLLEGYYINDSDFIRDRSEGPFGKELAGSKILEEVTDQYTNGLSPPVQR